MMRLKNVVRLVVAAVVALCVLLLVRTVMYSGGNPAGVASAAPATTGPVDSTPLRRLSEAVQILTVTQFNVPANIPQFLKFHAFLQRSFPLVHARLKHEVVDSGSLIFTWRGTDTTLAPVLFMGHMDVVPVEPGTEKAWTHPAFSGAIVDGSVWGRGTLDDKISVMGLLEATEALLKAGYQPKRTVLYSFGHTEEGGGSSARIVAELFKSRGISPWFVMDEGGAVGEGLVPGVPGRLALVGVAEKGYLTLQLTAKADGGHSSMPPRETAVSIVADAVRKVQGSPLPPRIGGATRAMFDAIGPSMPLGSRLVFANLWLFEPLVTRLMSGDRSGNAMVRTTTAATMLSGGIKDNVVPTSASAIVNFRLMPGDSVAWVISRVKEIVGDTRVTVETVEGAGREASNVSPADSPGFGLIAASIRESFGARIVAPYLVVGGTDARNFEIVSQSVYRFAPIVAKPGTTELIHATNEHVAVDNYFAAIQFFGRLIGSSTR
jgi:carboxypeptidase PM20D1